jgi:predicted nuclease with TOPRIM domain
MTSELYEHFTYVVLENNELSNKLQHAETENASLKSANERLENRLLVLSEQLEDANNEIGRLGMVLRHRTKDRQFDRRLDKQNAWPLLAAHRH